MYDVRKVVKAINAPDLQLGDRQPDFVYMLVCVYVCNVNLCMHMLASPDEIE